MNANQNAPKNEITIIAFVSGKGGVGKTMLAVAAAKELADAQPTLVLDLDFFNRGLSGLLSHGDNIVQISRPAFLSVDDDRKADWEIIKVSGDLYNVVYPDVAQEEVEYLDRLGIVQLSEQLLEFVREAASIAKCSTVVLDCHGGPDSLSFAACLIAQYSLLVSEPDRITMYGTLHFLRKLNSVAESKQPNINLVFNKVVEAFSPRFLRNLYNDHLKQYFDNRPLLASFPLEVYLTKEFEKYPFVTEYYPQSMLAQKMQVLLTDLLSKEHFNALSPAATSLPHVARAYFRNFLGRRPKIFTLDFVTSTGIVLFVIGILTLIISFSGEAELSKISPVLLFLYQVVISDIYLFILLTSLYLWLFWWLISIFMSWNQALDQLIVYNARRHNLIQLGINSFLLMLIWYPVLFFYLLLSKLMLTDFPSMTTASSPVDISPLLVALAIFLVIPIYMLFTWGLQLYRVYRDFRYSRYRAAPIARLTAFLTLIFLVFLSIARTNLF